MVIDTGLLKQKLTCSCFSGQTQSTLIATLEESWCVVCLRPSLKTLPIMTSPATCAGTGSLNVSSWTIRLCVCVCVCVCVFVCVCDVYVCVCLCARMCATCGCAWILINGHSWVQRVHVLWLLCCWSQLELNIDKCDHLGLEVRQSSAVTCFDFLVAECAVFSAHLLLSLCYWSFDI